MSRPTFAFDLDGTLVDSAPDLMEALNVVLREADLAPAAFEDARALVGGGARLMIERGLAAQGLRNTSEEIDRMQARFLEFYQEHIADRSAPYPGAAELLDRLAPEAHLVVVTNKYEQYAVKLLEALDLADRFAVIAGPDTYAVRKPDPAHLLRAVEQAGGDASLTLMIGDSITDVSTARAAGVPVIAVSYGYTDVPAAALGADKVIERLADVPDAAAMLLPDLFAQKSG